MFTNISQIIGLQPRHAEHTDTRQDIKRHDPDQEDRANDEQENEREGIFGDDRAVVSVDALAVFLKNFLQSQSKEEQDQNQGRTQTLLEQQKRLRALNKKPKGFAARAASAYERNAQNQATASQLSPATSQALLGGEDVRIIHELLNNIQILQTKNIRHITIEKGESFLMSLKAAVDKEKNG